MVDLVVFQTVSYIIAALSFAVTCTYYIMNIRNTQKNMQVTLETRKAQLYMSLLANWNTKEFSKIRYDSYNMEWTDLDDFNKKYNASNNSDTFASYNTYGRTILGLAELKKKGLIDLDFLDGMMLADIIHWWAYFGSLEKEAWQRRKPNWRRVVPFVSEVIEYQRKRYPELYDENGNNRNVVGRPWVQSEEMRKLQVELKISQ
jgi:hypothetical protein